MENALTKFFDMQTAASDLSDTDAPVSKVVLTDISVFHSMPPQAPQALPDITDMNGLDKLEDGLPPLSELNPVDEYQSGFDAGKAQAEIIYNQSVTVMQNAINELQTALKSAVEQIESGHGAILRQCLQALLPQLADYALRREMEQIIQASLEGLIEGDIIARFHPANEIAAAFFEPISSQSDLRAVPLILRPCETMEAQNIFFEWSQGGADISPHQLAKTCLERLAQT